MSMSLEEAAQAMRSVHSSVSPSFTVWSTRFSSMTRPSIMKTCRSGVREYSGVRRRAIGLDRTSSIHRAPSTRWTVSLWFQRQQRPCLPIQLQGSFWNEMCASRIRRVPGRGI